MEEVYYVYLMSNKYNNVLYAGVTADLISRVKEHKLRITNGYSSKYNLDKLVYYEYFYDIVLVIEREKEIKKSSRAKKIDLINSKNPNWDDLVPENARIMNAS